MAMAAAAPWRARHARLHPAPYKGASALAITCPSCPALPCPHLIVSPPSELPRPNTATDRSPDSPPRSTFEPSEYHQELQEVDPSVSCLFPRPPDLWSAAAPWSRAAGHPELRPLSISAATVRLLRGWAPPWVPLVFLSLLLTSAKPRRVPSTDDLNQQHRRPPLDRGRRRLMRFCSLAPAVSCNVYVILCVLHLSQIKPYIY
jgi:hypothetical protein